MVGGVGGSVGKVKKKKKNPGWGLGRKIKFWKKTEIREKNMGRGEKKVPEEKQRSGKRNCEGGGEKIKLQKKLRSGLIKMRKGKEKRVNLGWHKDRKENPISAPSIHVGALVGAGSLWPCSTIDSPHQHFFSKNLKEKKKKNRVYKKSGMAAHPHKKYKANKSTKNKPLKNINNQDTTNTQIE